MNDRQINAESNKFEEICKITDVELSTFYPELKNKKINRLNWFHSNR